MAEFFPGSRNQTKKQSVTMKIQLAFELLSGCLDDMSISAYTRNDQAATHDIFYVVSKGALIIRDLGYFTLSSFRKMIEEQMFFLSKFNSIVTVYDLDGTRINLLQMLKTHKIIDQNVLLGAKEKLEVRLIAAPLDQANTLKRKQRAEADRHARSNHSKDYMEMLGWAIYITNIPKAVMPAAIAYQLYAIRWKIEIIFKIWKSFFIITKIPKTSVNYVQCIIYAKLILILLANHFYITANNTVYQKSKRYLSPMKFAQFINLFFSPMWPKSITANASLLSLNSLNIIRYMKNEENDEIWPN